MRHIDFRDADELGTVLLRLQTAPHRPLALSALYPLHAGLPRPEQSTAQGALDRLQHRGAPPAQGRPRDPQTGQQHQRDRMRTGATT